MLDFAARARMTDIASNVLYRSILENFRQQFDVACRQSYVIALPVNEALRNVIIDQALVNSHILMPSKLLKMHYTPLQVGYAADDIEIDGKRLIIHHDGTTKTNYSCNNNTNSKQQRLDGTNSNRVIKILAEEIGHNSENRPYRLLIIDDVLISTTTSARVTINHGSDQRQSNLLTKSLSLFGARTRDRVTYVEPPQKLHDHYDCSRYLESISQQLTVELECKVQRIQSKYMILSHYLQDAADRIAQLTETFIPRYIERIEVDRHPRSEKVIEFIGISVENYAIHLLHGKLIASIYHRYEKNDAKFEQKLELIRQTHVSVCQLGAQEAFEALEIDDKVKNYVRSIATLQSPLAMVNTLVKIVDGISSSLDNCVRASQLVTEFDAREEIVESVSICSDDLIASLIFALVHARPSRIYSLSKYLELFNWSARDRAAYYTATFHVVVQYIYNYLSSDKFE